MATFAHWVQGARPRTLPLALAPVLIGTGAGLAKLGGFSAVIMAELDLAAQPLNLARVCVLALLAAGLALGLQIGSNYANDYSDGIRGTDDERVGPTRITAMGLAQPAAVKRAALISFASAAVAGIALVAISGQWVLIPVGVLAILAAWFYTGGKHPYGYLALGEVFVFVFFGLVATLGTALAISGWISAAAVFGACGIGLFSCAVLMVNNIRDIDSDEGAGKLTLARVLGDKRARTVFALMLIVPFILLAGPVATGHPLTLMALLALVFVVGPIRSVAGGAHSQALIPVLQSVGMGALVYSFLFGLGLAL